jgi:hypothetical protein
MPLDYQTFGPFTLDAEENCKITRGIMSDFFAGAESEKPGLSKAVGIYILAVQAHERAIPRPWYVGRTDKGFRRRFNFQLGKFRNVLEAAPKGIPKIFLIARVTPTGAFVKPAKKKLLYNEELEQLLIGSCLAQNPQLFNAKEIKHLREISVPGYRNSKPGKPKRSAQLLAKMLGVR